MRETIAQVVDRSEGDDYWSSAEWLRAVDECLGLQSDVRSAAVILDDLGYAWETYRGGGLTRSQVADLRAVGPRIAAFLDLLGDDIVVDDSSPR